MTLKQIISSALEQLGYGTDAQSEKVWHNKFTLLANEGMVDLGVAIKLRRTDALTVTDGEIDLDSLPYECAKVLKVTKDDAEQAFSRGSATNKISIAGVTGTVNVQYQYVPKYMSSPTDKPGIPSSLHPLIVTYICACHHMTANVDTQGRYSAVYNKYREGKARARRHYGEPENYEIINKPGW